MTFSNPAANAKAGASAYVRALLELLGGRDPLDVMSGTCARVEALVAGLDDASLRRPEAAGKWSVIEVVQHLADAELVHGYRLRLILTRDRPPIEGYDQDAWVRALRYAEAALADALAQLRGLRDANLRLLRSLDDRALDRVGLHAERGPESVRRLMELIAGHDLVHCRQIERIKAARIGGGR